IQGTADVLILRPPSDFQDGLVSGTFTRYRYPSTGGIRPRAFATRPRPDTGGRGAARADPSCGSRAWMASEAPTRRAAPDPCLSTPAPTRCLPAGPLVAAASTQAIPA